MPNYVRHRPLVDSDHRFVTLHAAKVDADGYVSGILELHGQLDHDLSDPLPVRHFSYRLDHEWNDSLLGVFRLGRDYGGALSSSQLRIVSKNNQASLVVRSKNRRRQDGERFRDHRYGVECRHSAWAGPIEGLRGKQFR
jgi:hypothetical protein